MFCPHCGAVNSDNARYCRACGGALPAPSAQPHMTGQQPPSSAPFAPQPVAAAPAMQPAKKKSRRGIVVGAIAGGVALIALAIVLVLNFLPHKTPVTGVFLAAAEDPDDTFNQLSVSLTDDTFSLSIGRLEQDKGPFLTGTIVSTEDRGDATLYRLADVSSAIVQIYQSWSSGSMTVESAAVIVPKDASIENPVGFWGVFFDLSVASDHSGHDFWGVGYQVNEDGTARYYAGETMVVGDASSALDITNAAFSIDAAIAEIQTQSTSHEVHNGFSGTTTWTRGDDGVFMLVNNDGTQFRIALT